MCSVLCQPQSQQELKKHHNMVNPLALVDSIANNPSSGYLYNSWGNAIQKIIGNLVPRVDANTDGNNTQHYVIIGLAVFCLGIVAWLVFTYCRQLKLKHDLDRLDGSLVLVREVMSSSPKATIN